MGFFGPESFFWLFGLIPILFWAAVIWIIVLLVRRRDQPPPIAPYPNGPVGGQPPALGILEERYARGEISRDEFVERRAVLLGEPVPVRSELTIDDAPGVASPEATDASGGWAAPSAPTPTPTPTPTPPPPTAPAGPPVPPPPIAT